MRSHWSKFLALWVVGFVLACTVLVSDQNLRTLPQQPERLPAAVVTVGDSTLSGEGGGNYTASTDGRNNDWCHRSPAAPVHHLHLPPGVTPINLACSGSRADAVGLHSDPAHVEGSQAEQLAELARHYRIVDVVVQVGANDDPGFTNVVNQCVEAWAQRLPAGCAAGLRQSWPQRVDRMQPKVVAALRDVRTAMDRAGYLPGSYSMVLQSYASPVGPNIPPELQNLSGCPFLTDDLKWIGESGVPRLSAGLRAAADQAGARFLDLSGASTGHEACSGGNAQRDQEWFTRLTVDWEGLQDEQRAPHAMQESFHPNAAGYRQFGRCLGEFLAGREQHAACVPDNRGQLQLTAPAPNG